jgi:hypothetical protein
MKKKKRRTGSNVTDKNQTGKRSLDGPPKGTLWKVVESCNKILSLFHGMRQLIEWLLSLLFCTTPVPCVMARKPIDAKVKSTET